MQSSVYTSNNMANSYMNLSYYLNKTKNDVFDSDKGEVTNKNAAMHANSNSVFINQIGHHNPHNNNNNPNGHKRNNTKQMARSLNVSITPTSSGPE
eukprot:Pgem_evm1s19852